MEEEEEFEEEEEEEEGAAAVGAVVPCLTARKKDATCGPWLLSASVCPLPARSACSAPDCLSSSS